MRADYRKYRAMLACSIDKAVDMSLKSQDARQLIAAHITPL